MTAGFAGLAWRRCAAWWWLERGRAAVDSRAPAHYDKVVALGQNNLPRFSDLRWVSP